MGRSNKTSSQLAGRHAITPAAAAAASRGSKSARSKLHDAPRPPKVHSLLAQQLQSISQVARELLGEPDQQFCLASDFLRVHDPLPAQVIPESIYEAKASFDEIEPCQSGAVDITPTTHRSSVTEASSHRMLEDGHRSEPDGSRAIVAPHATLASLFPVYLPLRTQTRILVRTQSMLEQLCFKYTAEQRPDILKANGWDCAEAMELHVWAKTFSAIQNDSPRERLTPTIEIPRFWDLLIQLRHVAVHRSRITADRLQQLLLAAEALCQLFTEPVVHGVIRATRESIVLMVGNMTKHKQELTNQAQERLEAIALQRRQLDAQETLVLSEVLQEDTKFQECSGRSLETGLDPFSYLNRE